MKKIFILIILALYTRIVPMQISQNLFNENKSLNLPQELNLKIFEGIIYACQ